MNSRSGKVQTVPPLASCDHGQRPFGKRALEILRFGPRRSKSRRSFLRLRRDHRHRLKMDRADRDVWLARQELDQAPIDGPSAAPGPDGTNPAAIKRTRPAGFSSTAKRIRRIGTHVQAASDIWTCPNLSAPGSKPTRPLKAAKIAQSSSALRRRTSADMTSTQSDLCQSASIRHCMKADAISCWIPTDCRP
jgi:hypothetical protein